MRASVLAWLRASGRGRLWAVLGMLMLVANLGFLLAQTMVGSPEREISGTFPATIHAPRGDVERALAFPGVLDLAPFAAETPVTVHIPVDVDSPSGEWGVLLRHPVNRTILRWDGVALPGATSGGVETGTTVLATVPAALVTPGTHRLEVRLEGFHGLSGALGELSVGPLAAVRRHADSLDFQVVALSSALHAAAMVWVAIAMFRPRRTEYLWGGLLWAALGVHYFCWSDAWPLAVTELETRIVVRESAGIAACLFAVLFSSHFAGDSTPARAPALVVCVLAYVYSLALPVHRDLATLRALGTAAGAVMLALCTFGYLRGARAGSRVARAVFIGNLVPASIFALLIATHPLLADQFVLPSLVVFVLWVTIVLVAHDADLSERYAHLFARARDAVLVVGRDGTVHDANAEAERVLGARRGTSLAAGATPEAREVVRAHLIGAGDGRRAEVELDAPEGRRVVESAAVDIDDEVLLVARDVTGRALAERSLKRLSRMESVGMIASSLVHDLNNALTGLLAQVDAMRVNAAPAQAARLEAISDSLVRVGRTSRQVVALVREGPPVPGPVDLGEVARESAAWVGAHVARRVRVDVTVAAELPPVAAVRLDLEQVVVNLVGNALRVTPENGRVRVGVSRSGAAIVLSVEDEGPGVPAELRERVWEPFFTTRDGGNGIGLAVVARVARDLGGTVAIEDGAVGARFIVRLPLAGAAPGVGSGVGVVAADPACRAELLAMLRERGFTAHEAEEGGPVCDVLVLDARGPATGAPSVTCTHPRQVWVLDASGEVPAVPHAAQVVRAPVRAEALGAAVRAALFGG